MYAWECVPKIFCCELLLVQLTAELYATWCNTLSDNYFRCTIAHCNLYFIPNYYFQEEERDREREGKERKRFMHYDGKGTHTLMALNGPKVAARLVDEGKRTW